MHGPVNIRITVSYESRMECINMQCGQNAFFLMLNLEVHTLISGV